MRRVVSFRALATLIGLFCSAPLFAQTRSADRNSLGSTLNADLILELPTADNLFQLLETTQPTLITDRFLAGGLYAGQAARVGGFLSSWSQTLFRLGDVSLTDPTGSGGPLLYPSLALWGTVDVATAMLGADVDAVGLAISLEPKRPTPSWVRTFDAATSHFGSSPSGSAPAIARIDGWDRATIMASGPLIADRLGLFVAGSWARGSRLERAEAAPVWSEVAQAFAHAVFTPTDEDEVRTVGWLQRASAPFDHRLMFGQPGATRSATAGHVQSTWEHRGPGLPVRFFASYTRRRQTPSYDSSSGAVVERLIDGPVPALAGISAAAASASYRWSVGGRVGRQTGGAANGRHSLEAGIDASGGGARASSFFSGEARELVDSLPARIWRFRSPGIESFRHEDGVAAHLGDRIRIAPRLFVEAAVRYDSVSGSAEGATTAVRWSTVLPRVALDWTIPGAWQPALFAGYAQSAYRLPLDWLAFGDPAAPAADVFRWEAPSAAAISPLVARVGPGTGGDPEFARIDPELKRPLADELVVGVDLRPTAAVRLRMAGMTRSERNLVGLVNSGAPAYAVSGVFDPGGDLGSSEDDRLVPVHNRLPESFGRDRYLLTNLDLPEATFEGIELSAEVKRERVTVIVGATAGRSETSAANRGLGPLENDHGLVGELAADPNAATFARGRPFTDRAYTAKVVGVYRFPTATTLGIVARYQDGQPFSRMLVMPALGQGADVVRAFASGDSRFMFTGTLDARVQQRLTIASHRIDLVLDAYNLLDLAYSVEERTTEAPDVRVTTAVQPPRTIHLGVRLTF